MSCVVLNHHGEPLEHVEEYGLRKLLRGPRVTLFPTVRSAREAIMETRLWAADSGLPWAHHCTAWEIKPVRRMQEATE